MSTRREFLILFFVVIITQMLSAMPPYNLEAVPEGYTIKVTVPDIVFQKVDVNDKLKNGTPIRETFIRISIPGFSIYGEEFGDPELLTSSFQLALEDNKLDLEITDIVEKNISLGNKIYPLQLPEEYQNNKKPFCYNAEKYRSSAKHKPIVSVSDIYTYRGQKAAGIEFNPVQYNPVKNILTVVKSFSVTFKMVKPTLVRSSGSRVFDTQMRSMFQNLRGNRGRGIPSEQLRNKQEKYLIIASSSYMDNADLQRFINFRSNTCEIELVSNSDVGTTKDDYKSYIRGIMPAYCVLVGRYQDFPTHSYSETNQYGSFTTRSYTYYAASETSSPRPDISLGLFFIREDQSLTNLVDKTISTETNLDAMPKHFMAFGGNTQEVEGLPPNHCDVIVREMYDDYFKDIGYEITELYQVNYPHGGRTEAIAALNEGVKFINYNGHGQTTGWSYGAEGWSSSNLGWVSNTIYPFVLSCACLTGAFTNSSECWGETWIGHEHLGSAFIAAQTFSFLGQHGLNRGVFAAIVDEEITQFGPAFVHGVNYMYDSTSKYSEITAWEYHYFGDPALETMSNPTPVTDAREPLPTFDIRYYKGRVVYSLPELNNGKKLDASIKLYTMQGKVIRTLVHGSQSSGGSCSVELTNGHYQLAAGLYLIKMEVANFKKTITIVKR